MIHKLRMLFVLRIFKQIAMEIDGNRSRMHVRCISKHRFGDRCQGGWKKPVGELLTGGCINTKCGVTCGMWNGAPCFTGNVASRAASSMVELTLVPIVSDSCVGFCHYHYPCVWLLCLGHNTKPGLHCADLLNLVNPPLFDSLRDSEHFIDVTDLFAAFEAFWLNTKHMLLKIKGRVISEK